MKQQFLVLVILSMNIATFAGKIIYLISPPRCLSTACMRSFKARKDFVVINEPAWNAYNLLMYSYDEIKDFIKPGFPILYSDIIQMILKRAETSHVLVKEISFSVEPFLLENELLLKNPTVHFIFLLRDPHAALISFAKKRFRDIPLQKFGYQASYNLFHKVKRIGANPPLIICAEELSNYPELILNALGSVLEIPFDSACLQWPDLGNDFTGQQEWAERKDKDFLYHWHDVAIHSTCFQPLTTYAVDAQGKPTFEEVAREDLIEVQAMYNLMFPFYRALLQETAYSIRVVPA